MLHMAMAGQWSDAQLPSVVSEDAKAKAKKLLKTNKMLRGDDEHARGMRAFLRAVASGRDAAYLLNQKGKVGEGAKHAKQLLSEDFTAADLDKWWAEARPKLVKGSRKSRLSRMNGCIRSLQSLRDGGVVGDGMSKPELNPVPKKERDTEDQPKDDTPGVVDEDTIEEMTMTTFRSYGDFLRGLDEANIPAPAVNKKLAGGGSQFSSKSKFKQYAGPGETYAGDDAPIPADPAAKGAEPYYPAVKGPVGPDAREYVDVRVEDMDPNDLVGLIEQIAEASDSIEEFAQLIEQHLGFNAVIANLSECENVNDAEALVGRIFEHAHTDHGPDVANMQETEKHLREKGMGIDDFDVHGDTWDEDIEFANDMMGLGEANIPAPKLGKKNAGGKQLDPKSRFGQPYKGPGEKYDGEPAGIPTDKEPQSAATYYGKASGQGPDGREEVDVRIEDAEAFARSLTYPTKAMKDR